MLKRPGILIPVFFLCLAHTTITGQAQWPEAASASLGGCYVTLQGYFSASLNQAGLGFIEQSSVTIQHCRPYLLKELGQSSISGQFKTGSGALGMVLAYQGLSGFRQTSLWLSYGMKLHPRISAGVGIHFWNSSIAEQFIYAPGISFALGLQVRINDQWMLGGGLFHPTGWSTLPVVFSQKQMLLVAGCSYSFLKAGLFYSELHINPEEGLILCNGLEWILNQHTRLRTGVKSRPFTFSWGVSLNFTRLVMEFSFQYRPHSGLSPLTSLTYGW